MNITTQEYNQNNSTISNNLNSNQLYQIYENNDNNNVFNY
jgi:hypothetical protein